MKQLSRILALVLALCMLSGCAHAQNPDIAATTLPVYEFTVRLCQGTGLTVTRLVTESVSCLHDYTLQVTQMRAIESAKTIVISGGGLEDFLHDALSNSASVIEAAHDMELLCPEPEHDHGHGHDHHHHDSDPHIWLSPIRAKEMAQNICNGLKQEFPHFSDTFEQNLTALLSELDALQSYGEAQLETLSCRELITFHDGFAYFAEAFDLTILKAVEEESGSEAAASELIELIGMVEHHKLPAIFTESNGSDAAAKIIAAETGAALFSLDMAMSGDSYFDAMYHNIDTIKEALG
jgi:ABC-type Zn uptake system ZnuABC Zn-binding protein ZnuA